MPEILMFNEVEKGAVGQFEKTKQSTSEKDESANENS
jgi:hypothetical protein